MSKHPRLLKYNNLKRELVDTNAYKPQPSLCERVVVDGHVCHTAQHFGVKAKENQDKVPTLYRLPKLHKTLYSRTFYRVIAIRRKFSLVDMMTNTKFPNCPNVLKFDLVQR